MPVIRGEKHLRRVQLEPVLKLDASTSVAPAKVDAVESVAGTSEVTRAGAGSKSALAGLRAVEHAPKRSRFTWRAAFSSAMLGLALLGPAQSMAAQKPSEVVRPQYTVMVEHHQTGPPPPIPGPDVQRVLDQMARTNAQRAKPPVEAPIVVPGPHQGLPDTLATLTSGMTVAHGTDPGDFYCEHAFYTTTLLAEQPGSTILRNAQGETMTSFLHNPSDAFTYDTSQIPVQSERHADRREIVGAAIRGYYEAAKTQIGDQPFRMLLTGYGEWGSVVNNPTGDFVAHTENVDAAMQAAFGDGLVDAHGKVLSEKNDVVELRYRIHDDTGDHVVRITSARLPVSDDAINEGPRSLQHLVEKDRPSAVLSMGVAGGSPTFLAEFHADDGGLVVSADGKEVHEDGRAPTKNESDNYSLARAIIVGRSLANPTPPTANNPVVAGGV